MQGVLLQPPTAVDRLRQARPVSPRIRGLEAARGGSVRPRSVSGLANLRIGPGGDADSGSPVAERAAVPARPSSPPLRPGAAPAGGTSNPAGPPPKMRS